MIAPSLICLVGGWFFVIQPLLQVWQQQLSTVQTILLVLFRLCLLYWFFHTLGYWFHRFISISGSENVASREANATGPKVAVIVPIRDEPDHLVRRMVLALSRVDFDYFDVVLVDNSTQPLAPIDVEVDNAAWTSFTILRKPDTSGFKAGAINFGLSRLTGEVKYVLVLDVDHAPRRRILQTLVPILEADKELAFVQSPQRFRGDAENPINTANSFQQRVFYDDCCPGMALTGCLFMTGTNVLIRRNSLSEIGGFDETTLTEDLRTSLSLHLEGWSGAYVRKTLAVGYAPSDLQAYHRQQRRWAIGTLQCTKDALKAIITKPSRLSGAQWWQYLAFTGTWYLQGFVNVFLAWSSLWFLSSGFRPPLAPLDIVPIVAILGTIVCQVVAERRKEGTSYIHLFASQALYFGNSLVLLKAFIDFSLNRNTVFEVTDKSQRTTSRPSRGHRIYHSLYFASFVFALAMAINDGSWTALSFILWPTLFALESVMLSTPIWNSQLDVEKG